MYENVCNRLLLVSEGLQWLDTVSDTRLRRTTALFDITGFSNKETEELTREWVLLRPQTEHDADYEGISRERINRTRGPKAAMQHPCCTLHCS